jgi:hypothetical protein
MRNGQSWFDPKRVKVRAFPVAVARGEDLAKEFEKEFEKEFAKEMDREFDAQTEGHGEREKGPYVAETFPVHVEDSYVIVEV